MIEMWHLCKLDNWENNKSKNTWDQESKAEEGNYNHILGLILYKDILNKLQIFFKKMLRIKNQNNAVYIFSSF